MTAATLLQLLSRVPRLFKAAALGFFLLGLLALPIAGLGGPVGGAYYQVALSVGAALVFWVWLRRDAVIHRVSTAWQFVVGAGFLVAAFPVAPLYLLVTRGWRRGWVAVLAWFAVVFANFGLFALGVLVSARVFNALHLI